MKLLLLLPLLFLLACNSAEDMANQVSQKYLDQYSNDITEQEISDFTEETSILFNESDASALNDNLDIKACFYRGHIANNGPAKLIQALEKTPIENFKKNVNLFDRLTSNFGRIDHVKTFISEEGEHIIVYRGFSDAGINYFELLLGKKDDEIKIIDIYVATSFEYISTTIYELLNNMNGGADSKTISDSFQKVVEAISNQEYEQALEYLELIDEGSPYRETKLFMLYELNIYAQIDDDKYIEKIEQFKLKYGNNAGVNLMLIDYHLLKEDYDASLECIAELQDKYPEDHLINILKGTIYSLKKDYSNSIYYYEIAAKNYPDMLEIQDYLLVTYFEAGDYENGFKTIDSLIEADYFTNEDAELYLLSTYDNFAEWPEYQKWARDKDI